MVALELHGVANMNTDEFGLGNEKRTKMFSAGNSETTGAPAAKVSPGRAITSATTALTGETTDRCVSGLRLLGAASSKSTIEDCASISPIRPMGASAVASAAIAAATLASANEDHVLLIDDCLVADPVFDGYVAPQDPPGLSPARLRVAQIGLGLLDFRWLRRRPQIASSLFTCCNSRRA